jgi:hypothetical protein
MIFRGKEEMRRRDYLFLYYAKVSPNLAYLEGAKQASEPAQPP